MYCICAVGKVQAHPCIRAAYVLAVAIKHFYISQVSKLSKYKKTMTWYIH